jgi:hypothetical protein
LKGSSVGKLDRKWYAAANLFYRFYLRKWDV